MLKREYYSLVNLNITTLSIKLLDENHDLLHLKSGQSTFIKLKFREMDPNWRSFMLRLKSTDSKELYQDNVNHNFRVQLYHPLILDQGGWQVAITSIHFPKQFDIQNVLGGDLWFQHRSKDDVDYSKKRFIPKKYRDRIEDIVWYINKRVKKMQDANSSFCKLTGKYMLMKPAKNVQFMWSEKLSQLLFGGDGDGDEESPMLMTGEEYISSEPIYAIDRVYPQTFFVYSDVTDAIMIGGKYANVLKMVPHARNSTSYECQHLDFIPINANNIRSINIQIRSSDGRKIVFCDDKDPVIVNLLFRRV
jgi:hypothetical protein